MVLRVILSLVEFQKVLEGCYEIREIKLFHLDGFINKVSGKFSETSNYEKYFLYMNEGVKVMAT